MFQCCGRRVQAGPGLFLAVFFMQGLPVGAAAQRPEDAAIGEESGMRRPVALSALSVDVPKPAYAQRVSKGSSFMQTSKSREGRKNSPPLPAPTPTLKLTAQLERQMTGSSFTSNSALQSRGDKLANMARGARRQLVPFANAPRPSPCASGTRHALFVFTQPFIAALMPRSSRGFYACLARAGGESRVRLLLQIAQIDTGGGEAPEAHKVVALERLIDTTCNSLSNFAVVGSLLFAGNFLCVIGRPPWQPTADAYELLGEVGAVTIMWVAYALACAIATGCLVTIIYAVGSKYLLTYILASLESKLCLLCELNPVGVVSRTVLTLVPMLIVLLPLGGLIAVGRGWGLAALGTLPVAVYVISPLVRDGFSSRDHPQHLADTTALANVSRSLSPGNSFGSCATARSLSISRPRSFSRVQLRVPPRSRPPTEPSQAGTT